MYRTINQSIYLSRITIIWLMLTYLFLIVLKYREAYRSGTLTLEGVKRVIRLDIDRNTKLFDFFVKDVSLNCVPAATAPLSASSSAVWEGGDNDEEGGEENGAGKRAREGDGDDEAPVKSGPGRKKKVKA